MRSRLCQIALLLLMSAAPALACPMCYSAQGSSAKSQATLRRAILTLLVPPVGIMLGLVGFSFRYHRGGGAAAEPPGDSAASRSDELALRS